MLAGIDSVGSAIEILDTGGEELKGRGRAVSVDSLLPGRGVSALGAVVWTKRHVHTLHEEGNKRTVY